MTRSPRFCRHCDEPIEDPEDEVLVAIEPSNSGGYRLIYAHVDHVALLEAVDPIPGGILAELRIDQLRRDP